MTVFPIPILAAASTIDGWIAPYHLQQPLALLLLPVILLAGWVAWRRRLPSLLVASIGPFREGRQRVGPLGRLPWIRLPLVLELLALAAFAVALARPQHGTESRPREVDGIDMMIAIDISGSMILYDIPDLDAMSIEQQREAFRNGSIAPRIDVARREIQRFVDRRPNDRIGLIAFAGRPYMACPPTLDHDFLKGRVQQIDAKMFTQDTQTNIAGPIASATSRLRESLARRRVLVLFTDGKNSRPAALTPREAADIAADFDIVIHTVGIGSNETYELQDSMYGRRFVAAESDYDRPLLEGIASATGGRFFEAHDAAGFTAVMDEIDALETIEIEQTVYVDYRELFVPWLWTGLGLLLLAFVLESTILIRIP